MAKIFAIIQYRKWVSQVPGHEQKAGKLLDFDQIQYPISSCAGYNDNTCLQSSTSSSEVVLKLSFFPNIHFSPLIRGLSKQGVS